MKKARDPGKPKALERPGRVLPGALRAPSEAWLLRTLTELRRSRELDVDAPRTGPVARSHESEGDAS